MKTIMQGSIAVALILLFPAMTLAQVDPKRGAAESPTHIVVPASAVTFQALDIPGFDPGTRIAAIHGDPNAESGTYVVRLAFPDGYKFPPHWHPMAEHVTVLEGELWLGMGDKADAAKAMGYKPGSFLYIPGKMSHFGGAKGATIIQLHGQAPFKIELTNPAGAK